MKTTIIGAGNLGGAVACGLARGTFINAEDITCIDPNPEALSRLKATGLAFRLASDVGSDISRADMVVLAVKPYVARESIASIRHLLDYGRQTLFSAIGGMGFEELCQYIFDGLEFPEGKKPAPVLFRLMPNIAISVGESMTFISSLNANADQIKLAYDIFGEMGGTMVVPERMMPASMAVGSCGTAYAMRYARAAMNGAIEAGFSAADALTIVLQTMKGAVHLLMEGGGHPEVEIDRVVTPGGYTIRGLNAMEDHGFSNAVIAGIRESYKNSK